MNKYQEQEAVLERPDTTSYRAAIIDKPRSIKYAEMPIPEPKEDELLIKLEGCGLCASNIPIWEGREWFDYPLEPGAPGHEGWGIIEKTGNGVQDFVPGERIAILQANAFAEYITAPATACVAIPRELEDIPFPGEPFGCLMNIINRADIKTGQTVAVIGLGFLGLGLVKLAKEKGARVLALSRRENSLNIASNEADLCLKMDDHYKIIDTIQAHTGGKGCDRVIECTGKQWPIDLAGEIINDYGKLIVAGYHQDGVRHVNMQQWNWKAIDVINAHERDPEKYKQGILQAIDATKSGRIKPWELLTHRFEFDELANAFDLLTQCPDGFIKAYINFK